VVDRKRRLVFCLEGLVELVVERHGAAGGHEGDDHTSAPLGPEGASGQLTRWLEADLPRLNGDILAGRRPLSDLVAAVNAAMAGLDSPTRCAVDECRRRLVALGMVGSSAERHSQEAGEPPGAALRQLVVGGWPFRKYVATLASRVGHPPRDSLLTQVLWNAPAVSVYLPEAATPYLTLPSVFADREGPITYSDDPGESHILLLLKRCVALEVAANDHLWPLCEGSLTLHGHQALRHVEAATLFLRAVRAELRLFTQRTEFTAAFFLDVFRQYACAWDGEETYSAPSGAHDPAAIARDILLGIGIDGFEAHVDHLFDVLDPPGQADVTRARSATSLADLLAKALKLDGLAGISSEVAAELAFAHPWLANYYRLYQANGDVSAAHWALIYKYIVGPTRDREEDAVVVSNREGTSGMGMDTLRQNVSARTNHPLSCLRDVFKAPRAHTEPGAKVVVSGGPPC
jgi:hypothetical protein